MALNFPLIGAMAPAPQMLQPQKKPDWRTSLFDRLMPDDGLDDGDKEAAMRQGLLGMAAGLLSERGFGPGLAAGIQNGLLAANNSVDSQQDRKYKQQMIDMRMGEGGTPSRVREFEAFADAAGLSKDERAKAARTWLYIDPKAANETYTYETVETSAGPVQRRRSRLGGTVEIQDPNTGLWMPEAGGAPSAMTTPPAIGAVGGDPFASLISSVPNLRVTSRNRTPEQNAALPNSVPNSFHLTGQAIDIGTPSPEQMQGIQQWAAQNGHEVITNYADGHVHLEPRGRRSNAPRPLSAAEQAGRATAAQQAAELSALPTRNRLEAQGAGMTTAAQEQAKIDAMRSGMSVEAEREGLLTRAKTEAAAQGEFLANLPKVIRASDETVALLDKAINHPGRATATGLSGATDPRNYLPGTDATNFKVLLDQLGGRAFLEAFESLKGAGQITEVEGRKATEAMARLNTAQSDDEFVSALEELRDIAAKGKERALERAQRYGASAVAPVRPQSGGWAIEAID